MNTASALSSLHLTAATLGLALVAAAVLVCCSPPDAQPLSSHEVTMPPIRQVFQQVSQQLRQMRLERETVKALRALDARTLADIGLDPSEISSVSAEGRRAEPARRLHTVRSADHA